MMRDEDFWNDPEKSKTVLKRKKKLERFLELWQTLHSDLTSIQELAEMASSEEDEDREMVSEIAEEYHGFKERFEDARMQSLLSDELDPNDAIFTVKSGAGGTEACDWAAMLVRMYQRYFERKGFTSRIIHESPGEETGYKTLTMEVLGEYAFGYLKAERGVHRLVRISPFDANKRRHTSFCAVEVFPKIDEDIEIEVKTEDIRIDTFRASGAGGQHVNKTDSAIRITHEPTGIVVSCQNERSQHKNREFAMKMLKARLYQMEIEKRESSLSDIRSDQKSIEWGSQIRNYVFHPYSLVKDVRTGEETGNVNAVMDGDIQSFIDAWLKMNQEAPTGGDGVN
jgi:peptide chain release factor 2